MLHDDPYFESPCYLDSREFAAYRDRVRRVIAQAAVEHDPGPDNDRVFPGITIRGIHEALGLDARIEWTADALEMIRDIEAIGVCPTRYRLAFRRPIRPNEFGYNRTAFPDGTAPASSAPPPPPAALPNRQRVTITLDDLAP